MNIFLKSTLTLCSLGLSQFVYADCNDLDALEDCVQLGGSAMPSFEP